MIQRLKKKKKKLTISEKQTVILGHIQNIHRKFVEIDNFMRFIEYDLVRLRKDRGEKL